MTAAATIDWINEHFAVAWYMDDGTVYIDSRDHGRDPAIPTSQHLLDHGTPTLVCLRCRQPSWAVSRHAAERHGDDVEVRPVLPGKQRPDWFEDDWI